MCWMMLRRELMKSSAAYHLVHLFLEVTQSSDEAQATQMLEWYGWQVDRAVSAFMLGDVTPPRSYVEDSGGVASGPGLGDDVGLDGASMAGADIRRNDPRAPPGMYSIVMGLPLRLLGKLLSYALTPINYALGVEEQPKDGGAAARRFVSQFQVEYGHERRPQFVEESYREAVREAARQHKFMMVYLHSPLHQDTPHFCRTTLCAAPMVDFMEHNVVVWGGSMVHGEAFAVSRALDACAFPYVALLLCKRNQVQVVERVEGTENAERLLDRLTGAMAAFQEQLEHVYRQQREVDEARRLREEQASVPPCASKSFLLGFLDLRVLLCPDATMMHWSVKEDHAGRSSGQDNEYRRGVEADRRRQEVQEEERRARDHAERLDAIRRQVRDEPPPGTNMARIRLQLPNGSKVDRRFAADATVGEVRGFLTLHLADNNIPIRNFSLSTNFPRKTYGEEDDAQSVVEAGLHPQVALFVHDLDA